MRNVYFMIAVIAGAVSCAFGQDLAQKLNTQFTVMRTNPNGFITGGSVLVLQKSGLLLYSTGMPSLPQSTYQNGKISRNPLAGRSFFSDLGNAMTVPGQSVAIPQRTFAVGEKLWVAKMDIRNDGVVFTLYSAAYDEVTYRGELKFPYRKNAAPPADQLLSAIAEVFAAQPTVAPPAKPVPPPADAPLPPIAPPPPPPADETQAPPKSISAGQTPEQVTAILGQPDKVVELGPKKIYYFKDIKVTFVDGKMTDAQ